MQSKIQDEAQGHPYGQPLHCVSALVLSSENVLQVSNGEHFLMRYCTPTHNSSKIRKRFQEQNLKKSKLYICFCVCVCVPVPVQVRHCCILPWWWEQRTAPWRQAMSPVCQGRQSQTETKAPSNCFAWESLTGWTCGECETKEREKRMYVICSQRSMWFSRTFDVAFWAS